MHSFIFFILCASFYHQSISAVYHQNIFNKSPSFQRSYSQFPRTPNELLNDTLTIFDEDVESKNASLSRMEENSLQSSTDLLMEESSLRTDLTNFTLIPSQSSVHSSENAVSNPSTDKEATLTEIIGNGTDTSSSETSSSSNSSTTVGETKSTSSVTPTGDNIVGSSVAEDDEPGDVLRGKPSSTESANTTTQETSKLWFLFFYPFGIPFYFHYS